MVLTSRQYCYSNVNYITFFWVTVEVSVNNQYVNITLLITLLHFRVRVASIFEMCDKMANRKI